MNCGLLGRTLKHSYSPQIHSYLGSYPYVLYEKEPHELADFFAHTDFTAINVTIPYKKDVIPFCSELTDCAKKLASVNTIIRKPDGSLLGHNTDYFGFHSMVMQMGISLVGKKILVLGSGGTSVTAVCVLQELGANVIMVSRTGVNNYDNLHLHTDAAVIVNTTPVGMYPNAGVSPVNLDMFPSLEGVLDVIYNPAKTKLLIDAETRNIPCQNGLWMLVAQAKEATEWFTGSKVRDEIITEIYNKMLLQMGNIVLIGMPGSGKSTIGKQLAQRLNRTFVDVDTEIERMAKKTIPDIFRNEGEAGFRQWETKALELIGQRSALVIATGGGCVTQAINYPLLHQNGSIYWIQRDLSALPTNGRPLSQNGSLEAMYAVRKPLYEHFADHTIINSGSIENAVDQILKGMDI